MTARHSPAPEPAEPRLKPPTRSNAPGILEVYRRQRGPERPVFFHQPETDASREEFKVIFVCVSMVSPSSPALPESGSACG